MTDRELFRSRFNELLHKRNLSMVQVAGLTGISRQTLYNWRSGRRAPVLGDPHLYQLADVFGVTVGWLYGLDNERDEETTDARPEDRGD
jgi:transcriptional regulator with XRE-family HTH domain